MLVVGNDSRPLDKEVGGWRNTYAVVIEFVCVVAVLFQVNQGNFVFTLIDTCPKKVILKLVPNIFYMCVPTS